MAAIPTRNLWPIPVVVLVASISFISGLIFCREVPVNSRISVSVLCLISLCTCGILFKYRQYWLKTLDKFLEDYTNKLDEIPENLVVIFIIIASALSLYTELLVIRWHSSTFGVFAHFKNLSLLSCFLGLGIGYALGNLRLLTIPLFLPALSIQLIGMYLLRESPIQSALGNPILEQYAHGISFTNDLAHKALLYGFLILIFTLNMLCLVPLGQLASRLMMKCPKLFSYGWNLIGSMLGIFLFTSLSFLWLTPSCWVAFCAILTSIFIFKSPKIFLSSLICVLLTVGLLALPEKSGVVHEYSPYQIISINLKNKLIPELLVNHAYYQRILNLSPEVQSVSRDMRKAASYYELPYSFKPSPKNVLIVGSGTGNDVAAALRENAEHIDAVEIDPVILHYGRILHPEKPYQNKKVNSINNDARTFIRKTRTKYDLIVYGLLDSHTLLSGKSAIRLDSFVYIVGAFREARKKLAENGIICMSFSIFSRDHGRKLYLMLTKAFDGKEPVVYKSLYDFSYTFVIGNGSTKLTDIGHIPFEDVTSEFRNASVEVDLSFDDWPFWASTVSICPNVPIHSPIS